MNSKDMFTSSDWGRMNNPTNANNAAAHKAFVNAASKQIATSLENQQGGKKKPAPKKPAPKKPAPKKPAPKKAAPKKK